jgi:hypothetical protein
MGGTCSTHSIDEKFVQLFNGKIKGTDHSRDRRRWNNNIKMNLKNRL